jgi:hypothetical protein
MSPSAISEAPANDARDDADTEERRQTVVDEDERGDHWPLLKK